MMVCNKLIDIDIWIEVIKLLVLIVPFGLLYLRWKNTTKTQIKKLEKIKSEFSSDLQLLKHSLEKENISYRIQFEFLHQKRAESAIEIYQKRQGLKNAIQKEENDIDNRLNEVRKTFQESEIYYSIEFCTDIKELLRLFERKRMETPKENPEDKELIKTISLEIENKITVLTERIDRNIKKILSAHETYVI